VKIRRFYELLSLWLYLMNQRLVSLVKVKARNGVRGDPEESNRVPVLPGVSLEFYQAAPVHEIHQRAGKPHLTSAHHPKADVPVAPAGGLLLTQVV
jgi:hypothetical protein